MKAHSNWPARAAGVSTLLLAFSLCNLAPAQSLVAPGAQGQVGTLRVTDVNFQSGSFFEVHIEEGNSGDTLLVTGDADLSGGLVRVIAGAGNYAVPSTVTILTAGDLMGTRFVGYENEFASPTRRK